MLKRKMSRNSKSNKMEIETTFNTRSKYQDSDNYLASSDKSDLMVANPGQELWTYQKDILGVQDCSQNHRRQRVLRRQKKTRRLKKCLQCTGDTKCDVHKCTQKVYESNHEKNLNQYNTDSGDSVGPTHDFESEIECLKVSDYASTSSESESKREDIINMSSITGEDKIEHWMSHCIESRLSSSESESKREDIISMSSITVEDKIEHWMSHCIESRLGGYLDLTSNGKSLKRKRESDAYSEYNNHLSPKRRRINAGEETGESSNSPQIITSPRRKRTHEMAQDQGCVLQPQRHNERIFEKRSTYLDMDALSSAIKPNALQKETVQCTNKALDEPTPVLMNVICQRIKMLRCESLPEEQRPLSLCGEIKENESDSMELDN